MKFLSFLQPQNLVIVKVEYQYIFLVFKLWGWLLEYNIKDLIEIVIILKSISFENEKAKREYSNTICDFPM